MSVAFSSFISMFTVSLSRILVCFTFQSSWWKLFLTLTILSPPQVSNLPFVRSKYIERVVCFASWKSARGTRLKSRWKCNNLMFVPCMSNKMKKKQQESWSKEIPSSITNSHSLWCVCVSELKFKVTHHCNTNMIVCMSCNPSETASWELLVHFFGKTLSLISYISTKYGFCIFFIKP